MKKQRHGKRQKKKKETPERASGTITVRETKG
jgi:hypothetical protein